MADLRGYTLRLTGSTDMVTETCYKCGVLFAMTSDFERNKLRDRSDFFCLNGHAQRYIGETDAQKLEKANAREVALRDQLAASARDAEALRVALLRDRQRFANGVCPCCNRSFENVRRHMQSQHPDYDVARVKAAAIVKFACSCGRSFDTLHGLRIHQVRQRGDDWAAPGGSRYFAHLTKV